MSPYLRSHSTPRSLMGVIPIVFLLLLALPAIMRAQQHEDFDVYKLRLEGSWFYSSPSGTIQGKADTLPIDFNKDIGFSSYSTFSGKVDWKLSHKNHLYVVINPFYTSRQTVLQRTIVFQGQTFDLGLVTQTQLHAFLVAPGYQYDIIRRKRGHLGIGVQLDLFNSTAKISAAAQVIGGDVQHAAISASGSLLAPLPVAGPQFRLYLTDSPRLFIDGNLNGMYFFGYGNFVSTSDTLGVALTRHISFSAGYQLATRLIVTNNSQTCRIGLHLTQKGPVTGLKFTF